MEEASSNRAAANEKYLEIILRVFIEIKKYGGLRDYLNFRKVISGVFPADDFFIQLFIFMICLSVLCQSGSSTCPMILISVRRFSGARFRARYAVVAAVDQLRFAVTFCGNFFRIYALGIHR